MSKSSMEDVAEAVRIVNALDKRGRLVILRDLQKQDLESKLREYGPPPAPTAIKPAIYGEGEK